MYVSGSYIMHHCIILMRTDDADALRCISLVSFSFWVLSVKTPHHTTDHIVLPVALFLCLALLFWCYILPVWQLFAEISGGGVSCANQHFSSVGAPGPKCQSLVFLCNFSQSECMIIKRHQFCKGAHQHGHGKNVILNERRSASPY